VPTSTSKGFLHFRPNRLMTSLVLVQTVALHLQAEADPAKCVCVPVHPTDYME
jgi:hypothetical protein